MPQGLQIFNADGSLQIDTNDSITRFLTRITVPVSDGSVTIPGLNTGRPFYILMATNHLAENPRQLYPPVISISGTTLSWTWGAIAAWARMPYDLAVGVF